MLGVAAGPGTPISRDASVNFSQMLSTAVDAQFGNLDIVSYMFATSMIRTDEGRAGTAGAAEVEPDVARAAGLALPRLP